MVNEMLYNAVHTEVNRIRKSSEASVYVDVSYKKLSDAAIARVMFWLKRIATMIHLQKPVIAHDPETVPPRMKSALKRYICMSDERIEDTYYLFKRMLIFLLRTYRPRNPLSTTLTVECVDESVMSADGPLYEYADRLLRVRSLPEVNRKCGK